MLSHGSLEGRSTTNLSGLRRGLLRQARSVSSASLYWWGQAVIAGYAEMMFDLDLSWQVSLPAGPKIFAANHPSTTDPFLITRLAPERMHILIDKTLFKVPLFGAYLRRVGHIPVIPGSGPAVLETALRWLDAGRSVAIFPEGRISPPGGGCYRPRSGVARLALRSGAPVIPVGIGLQSECIRCIETRVEGRLEVGAWYMAGPYAMTVGQPMQFRGDVSDWSYVCSISEQVMARILRLSHESADRVQKNVAAGPPIPVRALSRGT